MRQVARLHIGYIAPRLVLLVFLLDAVARLLPVEPLSFRPWEPVSRYPQPGTAFEPNRRLYFDREYGDLANMGNLPSLRQYRAGTFTTDALGFRSYRRGSDAARVGAILLGDSFGVGSGVSDDETLSAQLGRLMGCRVYNAAGSADFEFYRLVFHPSRVVALADTLGMRDGLVIGEYLERVEVPPQPGPAAGIRERLRAVLPRHLRSLIAQVRGLWSASPVEILADRAFRALKNDRVLPNSYASAVVQRTLRNDERILFLPDEMRAAPLDRVAPADHWIRLARELGNARLKLLVVLVPSKYTVYYQLLRNERTLDFEPGESLKLLEARLRAAQIPVVNLTETFRAHAARDLASGLYLYWLDDTHWNARGIAIAASEIRWLWPPELRDRCS